MVEYLHCFSPIELLLHMLLWLNATYIFLLGELLLLVWNWDLSKNVYRRGRYRGCLSGVFWWVMFRSSSSFLRKSETPVQFRYQILLSLPLTRNHDAFLQFFSFVFVNIDFCDSNLPHSGSHNKTIYRNFSKPIKTRELQQSSHNKNINL